MIIKVLDGDFSVCQLGGPEGISFADDFLFLGKTDQELSLVCRSETAPDNDGWKAFRIEGALDFSLVGMLAELAGLLARRGISIFAVSTYATDYILVKREKFSEALAALEQAGHGLV